MDKDKEIIRSLATNAAIAAFYVGLVAIGEATVMIVEYIFSMIIKKRPRFYRIINANQNIGFKW